VKQILCIKLVNYLDKYIEMHGRKKKKKKEFSVSGSSEIYIFSEYEKTPFSGCESYV